MSGGDRLEIFLGPGELHAGGSGTRIRALMGEGAVVTLWHADRAVGGMAHVVVSRRGDSRAGEGGVSADDALAALLAHVGALGANTRGCVAKVFVYDGEGGRQMLDAMRRLLGARGVPVPAARLGRGNVVFDPGSGDVWLQNAGPSPVRSGRTPEEVLEVYLHPGEWFFGDAGTRIRTLLGSCVSFTVWHPSRLIGGMCHYMLPARGRLRGTQALDGRYGDEALALLEEQIVAHGCRPAEFVAKMFGAGAMFETGDHGVAMDNATAARALLLRHGFRAGGECLGGSGHRNVVFDLWSGEAWVRRGEPAAARAA